MCESQKMPHAERSSGGGRIAALLICPFLGALVGFLGGAVFAYVTPKKFESTAVIQILRPSLGGGLQYSESDDRSMHLATEHRLMRSRKIIRDVVERLELTERWSKDEATAMSMVESMLRIRGIEGTDLVEVRVRSVNPADAREVAKGDVASYAEQAGKKRDAMQQRGLEALDGELRKQEDLVEEKRKILDHIVQAVGIPVQEGRGLDDQTERIYLQAERQFYELEREKQQLELQLKTLDSLEGEDVAKYAVGILAPNNPVVVEFEAHRENSNKRNELLDSGLEAGDPQVVAQEKKIERSRAALDESVVRLERAMREQLEVVEGRLEEMRDLVDKRRENAVDRALEAHDYIEAKQDYENAKMMFNQMKLQATSRQIGLKASPAPVIIHEEPRIGRAPVTPKVIPMLAIGSGLGLVGGLVIGVFVLLLTGRRRG